jgi:hypothetical protein
MNRFQYEVDKARNAALKKRLAASASECDPKSAAFVREPSANEVNAPYRPPGHGLLFCTHSKSYFDTCSTCKRDRKIARLNYERFCQRHGLSSE